MNNDRLMNADTELFVPMMKLSKDLKTAAQRLGATEARFLVDSYYQMQRQRIRSANQIRSLEDEPHDILDWLSSQSEILEKQVKLALFAYVKNQDLGQWLLSIHGIGPVIAAGLLAHIDWTRPTAGHIWRFAGLDPSSIWMSREKVEALVKTEENMNFTTLVEQVCMKLNRKSIYYYNSIRIQNDKPNKTNFIAWLAKRPWNSSLKTLCWKVGESFIKHQASPKDIYGKEIIARKIVEIANNDNGVYRNQAIEKMNKVGKDTEAYSWYSGCYPAGTTAAYIALASVFTETQKLMRERSKLLNDRKLEAKTGVNMLPPAHIHSRARRHGVKLFLSHAHFVGHFLITGQQAINPYAIEFCGHAHVIPPPNLDEIKGLRKAWEERQRNPNLNYRRNPNRD